MNSKTDFVPFTEDLFIPSIGPDGVHYTKVSKELMNEAVRNGYMNSPDKEKK